MIYRLDNNFYILDYFRDTMLLEFKIKETNITKINNQHIANVDKYNKCKFYFDRQSYQDKMLFAVFKNKYGYSQIVTLGNWQEVISCTIPKRFLQDSFFYIHTYAKGSFQTNTITVVLGKKCKANKKQEKALDSILKELTNKIDSIVFEDNQLKCYSQNQLIDTIFIDNVDEALVKEQIQSHFEEFEQKIDEKLKQYLTEDDITFQDGIIYIHK